MRKVKLAMYVSLDGVVQDPAWTAPFWNDELATLQSDYLLTSDALLLGRVTYEGFAAAWPNMEAEEGGHIMNSLPKFVASRTLDHAEWNATIIKGDVTEQVARLKEQPGQDLLIYGSGTLVDQLTGDGLIDQYRLMVYPVVVGAGKRLFSAASATTLRLVDSTTTSTGVVVLTYNATASAA